MIENENSLRIDGVVEIPNTGLYAKSPEALQKLFEELRKRGYEIKDSSISEGEPGSFGYKPPRSEMEKNGWSLWYAKLRDDVLQRKGKCRTCGSYIDTRGIQSHKHKCEICGNYTYLDFENGSTIRFNFISDERVIHPSLEMTIFGYDDVSRTLLLYPWPIDKDDFLSYSERKGEEYLQKNKKKWFVVKRYGVKFIGIPYDAYSHHIYSTDVISVSEIFRHRHNFTIVKLYKGKEYGEFESSPVPEYYPIWESWRWAPLKPSTTLHEKIISAAGMVSRLSYYYQDGRTEFYEIHLRRMRLFVENFTTLDITEWERMIARAPKSGPGMIKAIANFCSKNPKIDKTPSIGNVLIGVSKIGSGTPLTKDEATEMKSAMEDPKTGGVAVDFFKSIFFRKK